METINYLNCINKLKNISSTNEKIEKIKECYEKLGETWVKILVYAYDPLKVFNVKKYKKLPNQNLVDLKAIFLLLDKLQKREITGNKAIDAVENMYQILNKDDAEVFNLILQKDLKCGINKKLIQKALGENLFFEIGYMGAVPFDPKKLDKILDSIFVFSQEKMDGEYSNLFINNEEIIFYSRKNKVQLMPKKIIDKLREQIQKVREYYFFPDNIILNGELIISGYDRYTSNGLLTRIFKYQEYLDKEETKKAEKAKKVIEEIGKDTLENIINKIKYYIWDYQSKKDPYWVRLVTLKSPYNDVISSVFLFEFVETKVLINEEKFEKNFAEYEVRKIIYKDICNIDRDNNPYFYENKKDAKKILDQHTYEIISKGGEGTIIKDGMKVWKNGKPTYQIKRKFEFECELKVVGFQQGNPGTKFENALGAFVCQSEDEKLLCYPSGIAEDLRFEIWENQSEYLNKIITVKCNGLSKSKDSKSWSLLHPRFIKFREDKDQADTLDIIQKIEKSIKS